MLRREGVDSLDEDELEEATQERGLCLHENLDPPDLRAQLRVRTCMCLFVYVSTHSTLGVARVFPRLSQPATATADLPTRLPSHHKGPRSVAFTCRVFTPPQ